MNSISKILVAAAAVAAATAGPAIAQDFPSREVHVVVMAAPGGGIDTIGRLFADNMSQSLGQPVVVENRPGAAGLVAAKHVASSDADGYTLFLGSNSTVIGQLMRKDAGVDLATDLIPVARVAPQATIIVANPELEANTVAEVIELAKSRRLTYGSPGAGTAPHLVFEQIFSGIGEAPEMTHVPFAGSVMEAMTAAMSGHTDMAVMTLPPAAPFVLDGKVKGIVVSTAVRSDKLPDVETVAEATGAAYDTTVWSGFFVPAGTPDDVVQKLSAAIVDAANSEAVSGKLGGLGFSTTSMGSEEFKVSLANEFGQWATAIEQAGLTPE